LRRKNFLVIFYWFKEEHDNSFLSYF
jgi:hypothetical protein